MKIIDVFVFYVFFLYLIIILYILFLLKKDMYLFIKYFKFLIKDVKIVWVWFMKGISFFFFGIVDRDCCNIFYVWIVMLIFFL